MEQTVVSKKERLQALLREIPQYAAYVVCWRRGQGYFAGDGVGQILYFRSFAIGERFCQQCRANGRGVMADLRVR